MGAVTYADVNGAEVSFCSLEFVAQGLYLPRIKSLNWRLTHEVGKIRGTASKIIGRTRGTEEAEADVEIYMRDFKKLLTILGDDYAAKSVFAKAVYYEKASPADMNLVELIGARFISPDHSGSEGPDGLTVKLTLSLMNLKINGKSALKDR